LPLNRIKGVIFAVIGVTGLACASLLDTPWRDLGLGVGVVFFFLSGSALSKATQIVGALKPFVKDPVRVEVWGAPPPASGEATFEIVSIFSIGPALYFRLQAISGGPPSLMKVAQPQSAKVEEGRIEIAEAAYVSWAGTKIKPTAGAKMPAVVLLTSWRGSDGRPESQASRRTA